MSNLAPAAAVATDEDSIPVAAAAENAADKAVDKAPDLSGAVAPPPPTPDPTDGDGERFDAESAVASLAGIVTGLVERVAELAERITPGDSAPKRRPWTHFLGE